MRTGNLHVFTPLGEAFLGMAIDQVIFSNNCFEFRETISGKMVMICGMPWYVEWGQEQEFQAVPMPPGYTDGNPVKSVDVDLRDYQGCSRLHISDAFKVYPMDTGYIQVFVDRGEWTQETWLCGPITIVDTPDGP